MTGIEIAARIMTTWRLCWMPTSRFFFVLVLNIYLRQGWASSFFFFFSQLIAIALCWLFLRTKVWYRRGWMVYTIQYRRWRIFSPNKLVAHLYWQLFWHFLEIHFLINVLIGGTSFYEYCIKTTFEKNMGNEWQSNVKLITSLSKSHPFHNWFYMRVIKLKNCKMTVLVR